MPIEIIWTNIYVWGYTNRCIGLSEYTCKLSHMAVQGLMSGRASSREWTGRVSLGITFCC